MVAPWCQSAGVVVDVALDSAHGKPMVVTGILIVSRTGSSVRVKNMLASVVWPRYGKVTTVAGNLVVS